MAKKPTNGKEFRELLGKLVRVPKEEVERESAFLLPLGSIMIGLTYAQVVGL